MAEDENIEARLTTHEAICAERWKTVFNQLEGMETRASKRFDSVEDSVSRLETILFSAAGGGIVALATVTFTFYTML
jgi:hypothetical protein|tara:strand:+ start:60 stop:290 length:231 start_codon:yes stop_codon:yes gene_type:complete